MTDVQIKDDYHSSEENFERFKELKEDYDVVLAEVQRDRPDFEWKNFNSIFGKLFYICGIIFFNTLGRGQRDDKPDQDVKPLDLEFDEMPESLELTDKLKLGGFSLLVAFLLARGITSTLGLIVNIALVGLFSLVFLLFYFLGFMAVVNVRREEYMVSTIEENVSEGKTVLAYMGSAHSSRVKSRLEEKGIKVEREPITGLIRYINLVLTLFLVIAPRPIGYFRQAFKSLRTHETHGFENRS